MVSFHFCILVTSSQKVFVYLCAETTSHQDDEYAWAGVQDPKIMITTSHSPSSRLKQFAKVRKESKVQAK